MEYNCNSHPCTRLHLVSFALHLDIDKKKYTYIMQKWVLDSKNMKHLPTYTCLVTKKLVTMFWYLAIETAMVPLQRQHVCRLSKVIS